MYTHRSSASRPTREFPPALLLAALTIAVAAAAPLQALLGVSSPTVAARAGDVSVGPADMGVTPAVRAGAKTEHDRARDAGGLTPLAVLLAAALGIARLPVQLRRPLPPTRPRRPSLPAARTARAPPAAVLL